MKTRQEVTQKINELMAEVAKLQEELNSIPFLSPEKELATVMHDNLCGLDHTEYCSWMYEKEWTGYAHVDYLGRAQRLIASTPNLTNEERISVIKSL
jgi:hypothetical protein